MGSKKGLISGCGLDINIIIYNQTTLIEIDGTSLNLGICPSVPSGVHCLHGHGKVVFIIFSIRRR